MMTPIETAYDQKVAECEALRQQLDEAQAWRDAVEDELVTCCILNDSHADPKKAVRDAIQWNVDVALDPKVSSVAAEWQDKLVECQAALALKDEALGVLHELYAHASSGYGFARPENPHNFHPDLDCCSQEEVAAHSKACDDYASGKPIANESWGIGTYCDEYAPALKALAIKPDDAALCEWGARLLETTAKRELVNPSTQLNHWLGLANKLRSGEWTPEIMK